MSTVSPLEQDDFVSPHIFRTSQLVHRELAKYSEIQPLADQLASAPPELVKELLGEQVKLIKESLENSSEDYADIAAEVEKLALGDVFDLTTEAAEAEHAKTQAGESETVSKNLTAFFGGHGAVPADPSQQMRAEIDDRPQSDMIIGTSGPKGIDLWQEGIARAQGQASASSSPSASPKKETWSSVVRSEFLARISDDQQGHAVLRMDVSGKGMASSGEPRDDLQTVYTPRLYRIRTSSQSRSSPKVPSSSSASGRTRTSPTRRAAASRSSSCRIPVSSPCRGRPVASDGSPSLS